MSLQAHDNKPVYLLSLVIFLSRIPFLFAGYGSEEDAWGLILVARNIDLTGTYEVSRMPGHPLQELFLAQIWQFPAWVLNLLTAVISTAGVFYFMLTLRLWDIRNYLQAGALLAFAPVFYINSANVMDYNWALAMVIFSMYNVVKGRILVAGIILGLACGFRITAGAMVIPFAVLLLYRPLPVKNILILGFSTSFVALLCYVPAFYVYGTGFFTYYEYFPYPPFLKNMYKGTIGAWGLPGTIAVIAALVLAAISWKKQQDDIRKTILPIILMCVTVIFLYTYSFLRIPQKSAFVIPMIPFIVILFVMLLSRKQVNSMVVIMITSCFFFGINLDDGLRGSESTAVAIKTKIGNTPIAIDPLAGMVTADYSKRKQKITYAKKVVDSMKPVTEKTIIIAGWWQNEVKYFSLEKPNPMVSYLYYADEEQLNDSLNSGNKIFYLPEQDFYNDLRFSKTFTNDIAKPVDHVNGSASF